MSERTDVTIRCDERGEVYLDDPGYWPARLLVAEDVLDVEEPWVTSGDGMLRFILRNGDALYGYESPDEDCRPSASWWRLIRGRVTS